MRSSCYVNINSVDCMKSECIRFYFQSIKIQIESNLSKMGFIHNLKLDLIFTRDAMQNQSKQRRPREIREIHICSPSCVLFSLRCSEAILSVVKFLFVSTLRQGRNVTLPDKDTKIHIRQIRHLGWLATKLKATVKTII